MDVGHIPYTKLFTQCSRILDTWTLFAETSDKIVFFQLTKTVGWEVAHFEESKDLISFLCAAVKRGALSPI